ncbi:DUF934 domain-containing protein [Marinimicrobium sp. ABcell2]|uniref:DUF934 domain-containing protein n=1 Tax=Marinimicrobium sp. ABcell2 TaxID=3069751 RepID=UPI0027B34F51|nr:DUF934 domain-containing protein [Marinimicrobium sp. ABcell2]MDQ2075480.1 DUF934 domain-containing protein [Marinimicrobium sp. ABcell2]
MPKLVKDGAIVDNQWTLLEKPEGEPSAVNVPAGQVIVPLSVWQAQQDTLSQRNDVGVWLDSDETPDRLGDALQALPLIAVNFPVFKDGRAFSSARLLRERYGYTGEVRAIGHFIRDQLCYLRRCGVNAFDFGAQEIDLEQALKSLNDFTEYYQAASDERLPLFRRRAS